MELHSLHIWRSILLFLLNYGSVNPQNSHCVWTLLSSIFIWCCSVCCWLSLLCYRFCSTAILLFLSGSMVPSISWPLSILTKTSSRSYMIAGLTLTRLCRTRSLLPRYISPMMYIAALLTFSAGCSKCLIAKSITAL